MHYPNMDYRIHYHTETMLMPVISVKLLVVYVDKKHELKAVVLSNINFHTIYTFF